VTGTAGPRSLAEKAGSRVSGISDIKVCRGRACSVAAGGSEGFDGRPRVGSDVATPGGPRSFTESTGLEAGRSGGRFGSPDRRFSDVEQLADDVQPSGVDLTKVIQTSVSPTPSLG
jgi:hypothetical protein